MEKDRIISTDKGPAKRPYFLSHITVIARVWAFVTITVMWAAAVTTVEKPQDGRQSFIGWYLIGASVVVTWFEITWIINKSTCCGREGCCCKCWMVMMWVDNWKKGILYLLLSIPVFLEGYRFILGIVSGFLLIVCGLLYIVKTFKDGLVYTVSETRYVKTYTPSVKVVSHEVETQTEDEKYYQELYDQYQHSH